MRLVLSIAVVLALGACQEFQQVLFALEPDAGAGGGSAGGGGGGGTGGGAGGGATGSTGFDVAAGLDFSCRIKARALECFGDNRFGSSGVGLDAGTQFTRPTRLPVPDQWAQLSAGDQHACALDLLGRAWCWGFNDRGQCGSGDQVDQYVPVLVSESLRFSKISLFGPVSCGLTADHALYCWGDNDEGEMGQDDDGSIDHHSAPVQVGANEWQDVGTGQGHVCGIKTSGALSCWGRNTANNLGLGPGMPTGIRRPTAVGSFTDWQGVSCGFEQCCGLRSSQLWCWGGVGDGDLAGSSSASPAQVTALTGWTSVAAGFFHNCAFRGTALFCWGRGIEGQLGLGDNLPRAQPTAQTASDWVRVGLGRFHACALQTDGGTFCTGADSRGSDGQGTVGVRLFDFTFVQ